MWGKSSSNPSKSDFLARIRRRRHMSVCCSENNTREETSTKYRSIRQRETLSVSPDRPTAEQANFDKKRKRKLNIWHSLCSLTLDFFFFFSEKRLRISRPLLSTFRDRNCHSEAWKASSSACHQNSPAIHGMVDAHALSHIPPVNPSFPSLSR